MRRVRAKLAPESQAKRKLARPFAGFDDFSSTKREDFLPRRRDYANLEK